MFLVMNIENEMAEQVELAGISQIIMRGRVYCEGQPLLIQSKRPRRRLRTTRCDAVMPIEINGSNKTVILNNRLLHKEENEALARINGFDDFNTLLEYCRNHGGLPLEGQLVRWL